MSRNDTAFGEWLTEFLSLAVSSIGVSDPRRFDRELLERSCYPILIKHAERYAKRYDVPFEDAIQDGYLGLRTAAARFDPARKVKFITFAVPYIFGYIRREYKARSNSVPTVSFATVFEPGSDREPKDATIFVEDVREQAEIERRESEEEAKTRCEEFLARLKPKSCELVRRVHGINRPAETIRGIAKSQGISHQTVHQHYQSSIEVMRMRAAISEQAPGKRRA